LLVEITKLKEMLSELGSCREARVAQWVR